MPTCTFRELQRDQWHRQQRARTEPARQCADLGLDHLGQALHPQPAERPLGEGATEPAVLLEVPDHVQQGLRLERVAHEAGERERRPR